MGEGFPNIRRQWNLDQLHTCWGSWYRQVSVCCERRIVQQGSGRTCLLRTHIICSDYLFNTSQSKHVNVLPRIADPGLATTDCPPPRPTLHKLTVSRNSVSFLVPSNSWICLIYSIRGIFPIPIWTEIELTVAFSSRAACER